MERNAEERALRAEEVYQEGQRQLKHLEEMKREDRKVGAGNRAVQGSFHLAGKGLAGSATLREWGQQPAGSELWPHGHYVASLGDDPKPACPE